MDSTMDVQPGTVLAKIPQDTSAQMPARKANSETTNPSKVIRRSGNAVNDVMPSSARPSMRKRLYLVSPACLSSRR